MNGPAIRVHNLSKSYRIGMLQQRYDTLSDHLLHMAKKWVRRLSRSNPRDETIWALRDVSFEVNKGEVVGVVGRNGAGKSTLLKILSRITEPTEGYAQVRGRMGSLLEVGTGFHPELTGRENIYLNGAILGMRKGEIKRKFDEIVAFAEMEKFLDTPVKRYSSGMHVRLAFSVAAHLEPEILLIDEVLAVGDVSFQKKCLGKMGEVAGEGRTVLFVSHNMGAIRQLCDRALLIKEGRVVCDGDTSSVIDTYLSLETLQEAGGEISWPENQAPGGEEIRLRRIRLVNPEGRVRSTFDVEKPIRVEIGYQILRKLRGLRLRLALLTSQGEMAFQTTDQNSGGEEIEPGTYLSTCVINGGLLNRTRYVVRVGGNIPGVKPLLPAREYLSFDTVGAVRQGSYFPKNWPGVVCPRLEWTVERVDS
jgi:lipopolysaccharide transport system ATP-binding protein